MENELSEIDTLLQLVEEIIAELWSDPVINPPQSRVVAIRNEPLRRRKSASAPGQPPSVHTNDRVATLKNIWFTFDAGSRSVVVGPLKLGRSRLVLSDQPTVPALHEFGGAAVVGSGKRQRRARYAARPFMEPAMQQELPKFEGLWAHSVK